MQLLNLLAKIFAYTRHDFAYSVFISFQTFQTGYGQILTLNIVEMNKEEAASGTITVYDGDANTDVNRVLAKFPITNGTMPQGITGTRRQMGIRFDWDRLPSDCPRLIDCIKFTIIMDTGRGMCNSLNCSSFSPLREYIPKNFWKARIYPKKRSPACFLHFRNGT